MTTIDLRPLYRSTVGFDRLASMLDSTLRTEQGNTTYPPYDIEVLDDRRYTISLAVAGFTRDEIAIHVDRGVLTISGGKHEDKSQRNFLYQGIATCAFERKFNLADHVKINGATLNNGMLTIDLKHELPEAMKPKRIEINTDANIDTGSLAHQLAADQAA